MGADLEQGLGLGLLADLRAELDHGRLGLAANRHDLAVSARDPGLVVPVVLVALEIALERVEVRAPLGLVLLVHVLINLLDAFLNGVEALIDLRERGGGEERRGVEGHLNRGLHRLGVRDVETRLAEAILSVAEGTHETGAVVERLEDAGIERVAGLIGDRKERRRAERGRDGAERGHE